jgi:hypothetical protein
VRVGIDGDSVEGDDGGDASSRAAATAIGR